MNKTMQILSAAAVAGFISGAMSTPASAEMGVSVKGGKSLMPSEVSDKEGCGGKDGCEGKDSCGGKDGCGGK